MITRINTFFGTQVEQVTSEIKKCKAMLSKRTPVRITVGKEMYMNHLYFLKDIIQSPRLEAKICMSNDPNYDFGVIVLDFGNNTGMAPVGFEVLRKINDTRFSELEHITMTQGSDIRYLVMSQATLVSLYHMDAYMYDLHRTIHTYRSIPIAVTETLVPGVIDIVFDNE